MPDSVNATMLAFDYPHTLIRRYHEWSVLLRPKQPTLGSLVLVAHSDAIALSDLPQDAFTELKMVTSDIERALRKVTDYEKLNYLMLMMVDPHVHYHVIPRYAEARSFGGDDFEDAGWPGPPQLGAAIALTASHRDALVDLLKHNWPSNP